MCDSGFGRFWEADKYHFVVGDGVYDQKTFPTTTEKLDYVFFNSQSFLNDYGGDATSSGVSDHTPLRGGANLVY